MQNVLPPAAASIDNTASANTPEGLGYLYDTLRNPPPPLGFSAYALEEILAGRNLARHIEHAGPGTYLRSVLPRLEWWIEVVRDVSLGRDEDGVRANPLYAEQCSRLLALHADVLSGYQEALAASMYFAKDSDGSADMELLKRYRRFTQAVFDFALEVWPEEDLERLHRQL
jgi:hypothetical protein